MRITRGGIGGGVMLATLAASLHAAGGDLRIVDAMKHQDAAAVRVLVADGVDVNAAQPDGATALHWAAHWNDPDAVELLLRSGADANAANDFGVTPLALASTNANPALVVRLLEAGADPNLARGLGETPLMTAARTGSVEVVEAFLAHGADVNGVEQSRGQTALMWAVSETHPAVTRVLIEHGAEVDARSAGGFTPLLFAAREGDLDSARLLLDAGAAVNDATPDGLTPLVAATVRGHTPLAAWLLDRGADPNAAGAGFTALHWASGAWESELTGPRGIVTERDDEWRALGGVPAGKLGLIRTLLAHGADPNARLVRPPPRVGFNASILSSLGGATPFWLAAMAADIDTLRVLAANGADPRMATTAEVTGAIFDGQARVHRGTTPLMAAAGVGRNLALSLVTEGRALEAVTFIEQLGGNVDAVNDAGDTALHGAALVRSDVLVRFLVDCGARVNVENDRGEVPLQVAERFINVGGATLVTRTSTGDLLRALGAR